MHRTLGPGLLESAYQACLAYELRRRGLNVRTEVAVPLTYEGVTLELGYRLDMLVEEGVVVEVKAVKQLIPIHEAQLLSHLRLAGYRVGPAHQFSRSAFDGRGQAHREWHACGIAEVEDQQPTAEH